MIKAHLIRTSEVDEEVFASVVQYLQQFKGEVEFVHHDESVVIAGKPKRVIKKVDDDFDVQEDFLMNKLCDSEIRLKAVDLDFEKVNAYPWEKFFDLIKKFRKLIAIARLPSFRSLLLDFGSYLVWFKIKVE